MSVSSSLADQEELRVPDPAADAVEMEPRWLRGALSILGILIIEKWSK